MERKSLGIFQGDIVIRTAIIQALRDMRKNPWVLDYVFSSLSVDSLTAEEYGQKEADKAKKWFLATDIPVVSAHRVNDVKLPCISIALSTSTEDRNSLGDINHDVSEGASDWPALAGPFSPVAYTSTTGLMVVPRSIADSVYLGPEVVVVDSRGKEHSILSTDGDTVVQLTPGTVADFKKSTIRSVRPALKVELESAKFRESYVLGCHVTGEAYELLYLHSLLVFALLRYRQELFEARGFDISTFNSTDLEQNTAFEGEGPVYSRFVNLQGTIHQFWPKYKRERILGVALENVTIGHGTSTLSLLGS